MVEIDKIKIMRIHPDFLQVFWSLKPTQEDLADYVIDIYSSQSPSLTIDDYDLVGENLSLDTYYFEDTSVEGLQHGTRTWYYKLKIKHIASQEFSIYPETGYSYINDSYPNRN